MGWRKLVALLGQSVISVQSHVASCVSHFCASFLCYFPRFTPVLPNMCHTHVLSVISDPDPLCYIFSFSGKFAIQKENHQYLASVVKNQESVDCLSPSRPNHVYNHVRHHIVAIE